MNNLKKILDKIEKEYGLPMKTLMIRNDQLDKVNEVMNKMHYRFASMSEINVPENHTRVTFLHESCFNKPDDGRYLDQEGYIRNADGSRVPQMHVDDWLKLEKKK